MSLYEVLPATIEHGRFIAEHMRAPDRAEVWATAHLTPAEGVAEALRTSRDTFVGVADGVPFTVFGVMPFSLLSDTGAPWLLGTDELPRHARAFLRANKAWVGAMLQKYRTLTNYADARNATAIRWLQWLGFTILPAIPFGLDGLPFHPFHLGA